MHQVRSWAYLAIRSSLLLHLDKGPQVEGFSLWLQLQIVHLRSEVARVAMRVQGEEPHSSIRTWTLGIHSIPSRLNLTEIRILTSWIQRSRPRATLYSWDWNLILLLSVRLNCNKRWVRLQETPVSMRSFRERVSSSNRCKEVRW